MASRHIRAIALSLAVALTPVAASTVWAATPAATAVSLQATIKAAALAAASVSGFAQLTPQQKLAGISAKVAAALAGTGASPEVIADALILAVSEGSLSAGVAVVVAAQVAPEFATKVATAKVVADQLQAAGQSVDGLITAAIDGGFSTTVLTSLAAAAGAGGGAGTTGQPYDPCSGLIAAYCGS